MISIFSYFERCLSRTASMALVFFLLFGLVGCGGEKSSTSGGGTHTTGTGIELREIEVKEILIGIDGETIEAGDKFFIAVHEVSQAEFSEVLGSNPSKHKAPRLPVNMVTRNDAAMFCQVLTKRDRASGHLPSGKVYRLPTREEWLTAALPLNKIVAMSEQTRHAGNSEGKLALIDSGKPNAHGLHNMFGNAAEWTDPSRETLANPQPIHYAGRVTFYLDHEASPKGASERVHFVRAQHELMRSLKVLLPVAEKFDLKEKWSVPSQEAAAERLAERVRIRQKSGTDFTVLTCFSDTGKEAATLANEIVRSYTDLWKQDAAQALEKLKLDARAAELLMEKARRVLLNFGAMETDIKRLEQPLENDEVAEDEKRQLVKSIAARDEYLRLKAKVSELKQQIAIDSVNLKMPSRRVRIQFWAEPRISPEPASYSPLAIGGSVRDLPGEFLYQIGASGNNQRRAWVGFRFVMADE